MFECNYLFQCVYLDVFICVWIFLNVWFICVLICLCLDVFFYWMYIDVPVCVSKFGFVLLF